MPYIDRQFQLATIQPPTDGWSQVAWFGDVAGFIIVLLALRTVMFLLAANQGSPFVDFIYALSGVFAAPFAGIFPTPPTELRH